MADTTYRASDIARMTMDELLGRWPGAADVLAQHGVDPRTRCNHAVRHYLKLGKVFGRNCPIDHPAATLAHLEAFVAEHPLDT